MSIVEHEVLEVYEVQDGALQECMMFVKKLSETSLRDLETERNNLNDLLKEAEKEVTNLKTSLKTANSNVEELTATMKVEREQRLKLEGSLRTVEAMANELKTELRQSRESASALQKLNQEKSDALTKAEEVVAKLTAEKDSLEEELENLRRLRSQDEEGTNAIHQRFLKEQEKTFRIEERREEEVAKLSKELIEAKKNFSLQKEQADAEVAQLRQKLDLELRMNERLSNEADSCVSDIKKQLVKVTRENSEMQASKETFQDRLNSAEDEILTLRRKLSEEKQRREKLYQDNKVDADESKSQLEKLTSQNAVLTTEKEAIETRLLSLEDENKKLICRSTELQESLETAQNKVISLQEELQAFQFSHKIQAKIRQLSPGLTGWMTQKIGSKSTESLRLRKKHCTGSLLKSGSTETVCYVKTAGSGVKCLWQALSWRSPIRSSINNFSISVHNLTWRSTCIVKRYLNAAFLRCN